MNGGMLDRVDVPVLLSTFDEYLSEFTPQNQNRLFTFTGFSGSNGLAIINQSGQHLFWTDGRYQTQAKIELSSSFQIYSNFEKFLSEAPKQIKCDFRLHSHDFIKNLESKGFKIGNLAIPAPIVPKTEHYIIPDNICGESSKSKLNRVIEFIKPKNVEGIFISSPLDIAWLLNIRGTDCAFTPVHNCKAFVSMAGDVTICEAKDVASTNILVTKNINHADYVELSFRVKVTFSENILEKMRAIKNDTEIAGIRSAHIKDGIAVTQFLAWIKSAKHQTEISATQKLFEFRKEQAGFICESFATICGFQENGAIIHYHAKTETDKSIQGNGLLLVDSGGQYNGHGSFGTTDVTRVISIGKTKTDQIRMFTLVLKGHIALASAVFKVGTTGSMLDILARQFLWAEGLDYAHGTGHGVGAFLSVHEGPHGISSKSHVSLELGMIVSNEPGFYKPDFYGIRIENLLLVQKHNDEFLSFENLTKIPLDKDLIDFSMVTNNEKQWLTKEQMI